MQAGGQASGAAPEQGVLAAVMRLVGSLAGHFEALFRLFRMEAQEAGKIGLLLVAFFAAGLLFAAFAYIFLVLFLAFLCATLLSVDWLWIALALLLLHAALAAVCAWRIREVMRTPMFSAFSAQVRRDVSALRGGTSPNSDPAP